MGSNTILNKSFLFAIKIVNLYMKLINEKKEYVLSKQLLRAGTSIGANTKEGVHASSKPEFKCKLGIAFKEAKETEYWLELMVATHILSKEESKEALKDCDELCRILSSIIKTCNNTN